MVVSDTEEFAATIKTHALHYGVQLDADTLAKLCGYCEQVYAWNPRLHLFAPCSPTEFATRHVLESMMMLPYLPQGARVADVGSGAGLPIIPWLIARPDIKATLIEASPKKAVFLREALRSINGQHAATVVAERFEKIPSPVAEFVTCRALDRFAAMLPKLIKWSAHAGTVLLFGGYAIEEQLHKNALAYTSILLPDSEQRFLFVVQNHSFAHT